MAADERHGVVDARLPQLRRAQPVHHRRQRAADPGQRQPGADHHGRRRPRRRPAHAPTAPADRRPAAPTTTKEDRHGTDTVADYLLERLRDWGVDKVFALPRRRHQRHPRRLGPGGQPARVHPGPARGDGRVRGRRLRQVHRPARRLHGHLRARAPSTCSTACTTPSSTTCPSSRSSARPAAPRWAAPTSRKSTCSACSRTSPATTCRWSPFPSSCPTCWTGPSGSRWPSAPRPRSSSPPTCRSSTYSAPTHAFKMVPVQPRHRLAHRRRRTTTPSPRAAEMLNAGSKVAILAGQGARGARAELEQVADLLGAGVAKPLLGKDVLSDELPYVTGSIGLLGTRPSYEMMRDCDTLLTVGSSFPYTQFLPEFDQARGGADRHRRQVHRHALPLRGQPGRRRRRHAARADPAAAAQGGPVLARGHRGRTSPAGGRSWRPRPWSRPTRSTRCGCSTSCPRGCPTTRSSPPTPGPRPTGTPGS